MCIAIRATTKSTAFIQWCSSKLPKAVARKRRVHSRLSLGTRSTSTVEPIVLEQSARLARITDCQFFPTGDISISLYVKLVVGGLVLIRTVVLWEAGMIEARRLYKYSSSSIGTAKPDCLYHVNLTESRSSAPGGIVSHTYSSETWQSSPRAVQALHKSEVF